VLRWKRHGLVALRCTVVGVAIFLLHRVFSAANASRVVALVTSVGFLGALGVALPQLGALSLESLGWKLAFEVGGSRPRWRSLLRVRLATEALAQSLPVGVAFAESAKPLLLARHAGLTVAQSVSGMTARKVLLLVSQCLYVTGLATLGFAGLELASSRVIGAPHLGLFALGAGALLGLAGLGGGLMLRQSALARGVLSLLERMPLARVRAFAARERRVFAATDGAVSAFFRADWRRLLAPLVLFTGGWLMESVETWAILNVLGAPVSFVQAGSLEVVVSLVRNVVFVVPAGLGVQDLGYAACFAALGVPEAASTGAAFVLLKRGKELFWIAFGYALLLGDLATLRERRMTRGALSGRPTASERRVPRLRPANA
jgi:hypothetical protein